MGCSYQVSPMSLMAFWNITKAFVYSSNRTINTIELCNGKVPCCTHRTVSTSEALDGFHCCCCEQCRPLVAVAAVVGLPPAAAHRGPFACCRRSEWCQCGARSVVHLKRIAGTRYLNTEGCGYPCPLLCDIQVRQCNAVPYDTQPPNCSVVDATHLKL